MKLLAKNLKREMHLWFWGVEFIRFDHSARRFLWVRFSMLCVTAWCVWFWFKQYLFQTWQYINSRTVGPRKQAKITYIGTAHVCLVFLPSFLFSVCLDVVVFCFVCAHVCVCVCVCVCVFPSFLLSSRSVVTLFVASSPSCLLVYTNWACIWLLVHI